MKIIKPLILYASESLHLNGTLLLEVFPTQPNKIKLIIEQEYAKKLKINNTYKDYEHDERVLEIVKIGWLKLKEKYNDNLKNNTIF